MKNKIKSIITVPIIDISYKKRISKKNAIRTIVCKIKWINPANGNIQCSYGNAMCNPNDTYDYEIGARIAESRAKINMYIDYNDYLFNFVSDVYTKMNNLVSRERNHCDTLIKNLK